MISQLTLGVIGHVDHGKTALVRALTGIETDRLKEEKERGLSIVLGFSYLQFPHSVIDLIDVPGHEDFIRAMISGATAIDGVLLVVASNEGIMPQTREHFDIAQLLGIDRGLIVLTKTDLVTEEELDAVEKEVGLFVSETFLESAPVIKTSAVKSKGIPELQRECELLEVKSSLPKMNTEGSFLPIDRVFSMQGFGLVATGTLRLGPLQNGTSVEILPNGGIATIRGLQNHNKYVDKVMPGQRVAVNLRNIKKDELKRGSVIGTPGFLKATKRLDVKVSLLNNLTDDLKNGELVRVLFGATDVVAKVRLIDKPSIEPGSSGLVQLRCQSDVVTHKTERFIIRSLSPIFTIGGGEILDLNPNRHRRFDESVINRLNSVVDGDLFESLCAALKSAGMQGLEIEVIRKELGISPKEMSLLAQSANTIALGELKIIDKTIYKVLKGDVLSCIDSYHKKNPRKRGLTVGSLSKFLTKQIANSVLSQAIKELTSEGQLREDSNVYSRPNFDPFKSLSESEQKVAIELEQIYKTRNLTPPSVDEVIKDNDRQDAYRLLCEIGTLIRLKTYDRSSNFVLHRDVIHDVRCKLKKQFPYPTGFTVSEVRDYLSASRKYIIPLLEHLDATGITVRTGSVRRLRDHQ